MVFIGSRGIFNCHATRCICWVLVFASSKYQNVIYLFNVKIQWLVRESHEPKNQLNVCTTSENEGGVGAINDHSKAVVLFWFSVACFGLRVLVAFHFMFIQFSSGRIAEWPSYVKELLSRLGLFSLYFDYL